MIRRFTSLMAPLRTGPAPSLWRGTTRSRPCGRRTCSSMWVSGGDLLTGVPLECAPSGYYPYTHAFRHMRAHTWLFRCCADTFIFWDPLFIPMRHLMRRCTTAAQVHQGTSCLRTFATRPLMLLPWQVARSTHPSTGLAWHSAKEQRSFARLYALLLHLSWWLSGILPH